MIVTRRWLSEFINISDIDDNKLYETFNSIGLEVDSIKKLTIPKNVVVGKVVECSKHPNADKLNLCKVDVGKSEPLQIVCGAANVVDAEYVAVATVGAVLPGDFEIKPAKLRGVDSYGMICSSSELGLPQMGKGIMILDSSIGQMILGKPLSEYEAFNDTVIELELTANRGDCLSIRGVARDLAAYFGKDIKRFAYSAKHIMKTGIARELSLHSEGDIECDIKFMLATPKECAIPISMQILLALCGEYQDDKIESILAYSTHATGVILRAYDANKLKGNDGRIDLKLKGKKEEATILYRDDTQISIVGISMNEEYKANSDSDELLIEASYTEPEILVNTVAKNKLNSDALYYKSSRGSEPDLKFGLDYLQKGADSAGECEFSADAVKVIKNRTSKKISVDIAKLNAIIGEQISRTTIHKILSGLGFEIYRNESDRFSIRVPAWRHDIENVYDVAEEVLRMVGINNITAKPLELIEKNRLSQEARLFRKRRDIRQRAVSAGFYEAVTYAFADAKKLKQYGFVTLKDGVEILNPIVDEMDTLRSTLILNLLDAIKRNRSYGKRMIPLFEIGSVFDENRNESEKITFVWSGDKEEPSIINQGKPAKIDFGEFVEKISAVTGALELRSIENMPNELLHPYQCAEVFKDGVYIGYLGQLHPVVAEEFDIDITYIAEFDLMPLIGGIKQANSISNFQGVYKDLSILVDEDMPYSEVEGVLSKVEDKILKRYFPIDIYSDERLGEKKSLTIRFYLQSMSSTLSDKDIEQTMETILNRLLSECRAELR